MRTFGATHVTTRRGAAQLPGVLLLFDKSPGAVAGTKGRAIDHIGFEIRDLKAFTEKLERDGTTLDRAFMPLPALEIDLAFVSDPFGTSIELTEGLNKIH
jgi:hypothetical protein